VLIESLMKAGVSGSNRLCQVQSQPTPCVLDPFAIVWLSEEGGWHDNLVALPNSSIHSTRLTHPPGDVVLKKRISDEVVRAFEGGNDE
jgi:hypothetical protein